MTSKLRKYLTMGFATLAIAGGMFATHAHAAYYCTWSGAHGYVCKPG